MMMMTPRDAPISRASFRTGSLKELLRQRLVECGWRDKLKQHCKGVAFHSPLPSPPLSPWPAYPCWPTDVVKAKGMDQVTVEELVAEITPTGRGWHLLCSAAQFARPPNPLVSGGVR